ncbi:unnamed protein product [Ilex paraguariensis]|uniref:Uncharacterized protein n=1 Tax=Ilex paraguariensis TaxID=185542 RepID=A0ABC8SP29_9AQUA
MSSFPVSPSWTPFFRPKMNSFTESSADCIAFLICHCKSKKKGTKMVLQCKHAITKSYEKKVHLPIGKYNPSKDKYQCTLKSKIYIVCQKSSTNCYKLVYYCS